LSFGWLRNIYKAVFVLKDMIGKRGQGLSVTTLVLIVIGVLVLVFLILGFTIGWQKILPFINPGNNVDDISQQCKIACNTQSEYDYCTVKRDLKVEEDITGVTDGGKARGTCYDFATVSQLGFDGCAQVSCDGYSDKKYVQCADGDEASEVGGVWKCVTKAEGE
jgi:hypothetical protein